LESVLSGSLGAVVSIFAAGLDRAIGTTGIGVGGGTVASGCGGVTGEGSGMTGCGGTTTGSGMMSSSGSVGALFSATGGKGSSSVSSGLTVCGVSSVADEGDAGSTALNCAESSDRRADAVSPEVTGPGASFDNGEAGASSEIGSIVGGEGCDGANEMLSGAGGSSVSSGGASDEVFSETGSTSSDAVASGASGIGSGSIAAAVSSFTILGGSSTAGSLGAAGGAFSRTWGSRHFDFFEAPRPRPKRSEKLADSLGIRDIILNYRS
jgi:hypothetical protein